MICSDDFAVLYIIPFNIIMIVVSFMLFTLFCLHWFYRYCSYFNNGGCRYYSGLHHWSTPGLGVQTKEETRSHVVSFIAMSTYGICNM